MILINVDCCWVIAKDLLTSDLGQLNLFKWNSLQDIYTMMTFSIDSLQSMIFFVIHKQKEFEFKKIRILKNCLNSLGFKFVKPCFKPSVFILD